MKIKNLLAQIHAKDLIETANRVPGSCAVANVSTNDAEADQQPSCSKSERQSTRACQSAKITTLIELQSLKMRYTSKASCETSH